MTALFVAVTRNGAIDFYSERLSDITAIYGDKRDMVPGIVIRRATKGERVYTEALPMVTVTVEETA